MSIIQLPSITTLLQITNGILLKPGIKIAKISDERKEKQKKIAQDAKNDTQDKQEVIAIK